MPTEFKPVDPDDIFRECDARRIFGYGATTLRQKIKSGEIPAPVLLSPPPSRAKGWYGHMINEHRKKVEAEQEAWAAARTDEKGAKALRYEPKGGNLRKAAAATATAKPKKKVKLIPPRKAKG